MFLNLSNFQRFCKDNSANILLFLVIFLLIVLSFGVGVIVGHNLSKEPIQVEAPK